MPHARTRIGLFGGSFDPIHLGHLIMAEDAVHFARLDQLIFLPAFSSPLRENLPGTSASDRLAMVRLATDAFPSFAVDDFDIQQGRRVYCYEIAEHYRKSFPDAELFFLIGGDQYRQLDRWERCEEIRRELTFICARRGDDESTGRTPANETGDSDILFLPNRRVDISASEIRERVKTNRSIRSLVPREVAAFIDENSLYRRG